MSRRCLRFGDRDRVVVGRVVCVDARTPRLPDGRSLLGVCDRYDCGYCYGDSYIYPSREGAGSLECCTSVKVRVMKHAIMLLSRTMLEYTILVPRTLELYSST